MQKLQLSLNNFIDTKSLSFDLKTEVKTYLESVLAGGIEDTSEKLIIAISSKPEPLDYLAFISLMRTGIGWGIIDIDIHQVDTCGNRTYWVGMFSGDSDYADEISNDAERNEILNNWQSFVINDLLKNPSINFIDGYTPQHLQLIESANPDYLNLLLEECSEIKNKLINT
jgi:hypothetical protein